MSVLKPCPLCGTDEQFECDYNPIKELVNYGWISVDDRLPQDGDHIIMCTEHGDRFSGRGRVLIGNLNHPEPSVGKMTRYTHWQPMPPAPKQ